MTDSFSALHPALTFCYFAAVLLLTMFVLHPVFLALSLLGALGYCAQLRGWRSLWRTLGRLVPFLVLMAALNALFNHAGVTMLFYLPNGNPVTREALCYGAAAAAMFAAKEAFLKAVGAGIGAAGVAGWGTDAAGAAGVVGLAGCAAAEAVGMVAVAVVPLAVAEVFFMP